MFMLLTIGEVSAPGAQEPSEAIVRAVEDGPVHLTLGLDRATLRIDDPLRLSLSVDAPDGTVVELPELADEPGRLKVVSQEKDVAGQTIGDSRRVWRQSWLLNLEYVGEIGLPALVVRYRLPAGSTDERLEIEPSPITVTSVLPPGANPTQLRDIGAPMVLPEGGTPAAVWIALGALATCERAVSRKQSDSPGGTPCACRCLPGAMPGCRASSWWLWLISRATCAVSLAWAAKRDACSGRPQPWCRGSMTRSAIPSCSVASASSCWRSASPGWIAPTRSGAMPPP
jgi:hypothetical protein